MRDGCSQAVAGPANCPNGSWCYSWTRLGSQQLGLVLLNPTLAPLRRGFFIHGRARPISLAGGMWRARSPAPSEYGREEAGESCDVPAFVADEPAMTAQTAWHQFIRQWQRS